MRHKRLKQIALVLLGIASPIVQVNAQTVTDIDGNVYTTVTIGTQEWMSENLKTTKYKDGTDIPLVTDGKEWRALGTPAYCWFNNDTVTYKNTYGALYNWYTVNTSKLCPTSWHVPSDEEWTTMKNYLIANGYNYDGTTSGNNIAKSLAATSKWMYSINAGAPGNINYPSYRNKTGFTALPGGNRLRKGTFYKFGYSGLWWSASMYTASFANVWCVYYSKSNLSRTDGNKRSGFSVRCVRD